MPSLIGPPHDDLLLQYADATLRGTAKGDALAKLVGHIIASTPGVSEVQYSRLDAFQAQEVDITFCQQSDPNGFPPHGRLETQVFAECKNLAHPMDARDVAWFFYKLYTRGSRFGMIFAAQGLTGRDRRTGAQDVIKTALSLGVTILAFNGQEIVEWEHTDDFIAAVKRRIGELLLNRTIVC